eukprot:scaffold208120_cov18-Prasinocladus_malaysianus.AAC.1
MMLWVACARALRLGDDSSIGNRYRDWQLLLSPQEYVIRKSGCTHIRRAFVTTSSAPSSIPSHVNR